MIGTSNQVTSQDIIEKAQAIPGVLAGIASAEALKTSPSTLIYQPVGWKTAPMYDVKEAASWPEEAKSVLVLAIPHPKDRPELDWWDGGNTNGNRELIGIAAELVQQLKREYDINAVPLPYHPEKGGVLLKDAAVLAGLGVIGRNNLFVHPKWGPRVRLKAMFLDIAMEPSVMEDDFKPCDDCPAPCLSVCPEQALANASYSREKCLVELENNRDNRETVFPDGPEKQGVDVVKYCRACEFACIASKKTQSRL